MKAIILVMLFLSPSGDLYMEQIGPFADRRECAEAAVRLTEIASRNGIKADGACIGVAEGR
jgi:hypothetical protein